MKCARYCEITLNAIENEINRIYDVISEADDESNEGYVDGLYGCINDLEELKENLIESNSNKGNDFLQNMNFHVALCPKESALALNSLLIQNQIEFNMGKWDGDICFSMIANDSTKELVRKLINKV